MKIIELADLHLDPKWLEQQKPCLDLIFNTVKQEKPDFICIAGDIYNRPFYNSEKDCIKYVLDYFEKLQSISQIIMVTGTTSHDALGSYVIFEKMGCVVLRPERPPIIKECLFIGLPEIDKTTIMAKNQLKSMDHVNKHIEELLNHFITSYWAPVRVENKNIPCILLGHGMFIDNPYDENPIIKNTDVIIDNNKLKEIGADRYIFGHIHTPSESHVLNGGYVGYAGFDRTPWNNTGFQPGFNVTEITKQSGYYPNDPILKYKFKTETTRIDYPISRKEKINCDNIKKLDNLDNYYNLPGCDFRINLKILKSELSKINIHEYEEKIKNLYNLNSCEIIPDIIKEESNRITSEQAEKLHTLNDKYEFFKGNKQQESIQQKISEIEKNVSLKSQSQNKKNVTLDYLEVKNSIFSIDAQGKNTFIHDFSNDPSGLTLISGDNGKGKSTYFGFANPYPVFIGFDYRSLKEFFVGDGHIIKRFTVNGMKHEHKIYVGKKIECFWNYQDKDGQWISFTSMHQEKEFFMECVFFFGPLSSFISTSFFSQEPWRMKNYVSSLVSSSPTELRNAYLEIVGISRETEKLYARDKKDNLKAEMEKLEIKKTTIENIIKDKTELLKKKEIIIQELNELDTEFGILVHDENEKQKQFSGIEKKYNEQIEIGSKIFNIKDKLDDLNHELNTIQEKIDKIKNINIADLNSKIKNQNEIKNKIDFMKDQWHDINTHKNKILECIQYEEDCIKTHTEQLNDIKEMIRQLTSENELKQNENRLLNIPCENCGYIKKENSEKIKENNIIIEKNKTDICNLRTDELHFSELIDEHKNSVKSKRKELPDFELKKIETDAEKLKWELLSDIEIEKIRQGIAEYSQIEIYENQKKEKKENINKQQTKLNALQEKQEPDIIEQYKKIKSALEDIKSDYQKKNNEVSEKKGILSGINEQLKKMADHEKQIIEITEKISMMKIDVQEWEQIEKDMQANKLPALELDIIASEIDYEVNQKLAGKYIIRTVTQEINKQGEIIDRFDILVYNPRSGIEKSLLKHSPGQRTAYFIEPISQALRERRQKREGIVFAWSVADETDNPIKFERVREYYEIMAAGLPADHTRFIMSQKSEIYQFIKNTIDIESIGINS